MSNRATVWSVGSYVPRRKVTNKMLSQHLETSDEWIRARTGIRERRYAAADETAATLSTYAARAALHAAGVGAEKLDWVLVCTDTPEMWSPPTACFVQDALSASHASAIDLTGGCAGFLQTLQLAEGMAAAGARVLVVGTELLSRFVDPADRHTAVLFGDASAAFLLGSSAERQGLSLGRSLSQSDGSQADILTNPYGGVRHEITAEVAATGAHHTLHMDGPKVFKHAVHRMSQAGEALLAESGLTSADLDWIVPHQANQRIIDAVTHQLGLDPSRVFSHVDRFANTGSASVALAVADMLHQQLIRPRQALLLVAFGAGFSWAARMLTADALAPVLFLDGDTV